MLRTWGMRGIRFGLRDLPFCDLLAGVLELLDGQAHYCAPRYHIRLLLASLLPTQIPIVFTSHLSKYSQKSTVHRIAFCMAA